MILRKEEIAKLREADSLLAEARRTLEDARKEALRILETAETEARQKALAEATRSAARIIARAEADATRRIDGLEQQLARLVAQTVRSVIGGMEQDEAAYHAALTALRQLRDHPNARIHAPAEAMPALRRALVEADSPAQLVVDDRLEAGRAILSSDRGHAEIGLSALTDAALRPWEEE